MTTIEAVSKSLESTLMMIADCHQISKYNPDPFLNETDPWTEVHPTIVSLIREILDEDSLKHESVVAEYSTKFIRASSLVRGALRAGDLRAASAHELAAMIQREFIDRVVPDWNDFLDWIEGAGGSEWLEDQGYTNLTDEEKFDLVLGCGDGIGTVRSGLSLFPSFDVQELVIILRQERAFLTGLNSSQEASSAVVSSMEKVDALDHSRLRPARLEPDGQDARHSEDFRSVHWFGLDFTFTANQAAVVKKLWEAWMNSTPVLSGESLLDASESESGRVSVVFRGNPACGTMIIRRGKGSYRLQEPTK